MTSSMKVPSSISRSSRSRAVSLSCPCWRSIFSGPPPRRAFSRRSWRSSTSARRGGRATSWSGAARSVVDMGPLGDRCQERLHHLGGHVGGLLAREAVLGRLERGDLEPHQLAVLHHGLEQVVDLV